MEHKVHERKTGGPGRQLQILAPPPRGLKHYLTWVSLNSPISKLGVKHVFQSKTKREAQGERSLAAAVSASPKFIDAAVGFVPFLPAFSSPDKKVLVSRCLYL